MSVLGLGTDVVRILRIARLLEGPKRTRFLDRILHPAEKTALVSISPAQQLRYVAGAWAVKEAVFKALDHEKQQVFLFREWRRDYLHGRPVVRSEVPLELDFHVSVSHDGDILVATVIRTERQS